MSENNSNFGFKEKYDDAQEMTPEKDNDSKDHSNVVADHDKQIRDTNLRSIK